MARIGITLCIPDFTGACKMARAYAQALITAGHQVLLMYGSEEIEAETRFLKAIREDGVETKQIPGLVFPLFPSVVTETANAAKQFQADCIISFHPRDCSVALKAAARLKIKGLASFQTLHVFHGPLFIPHLKEFIYRRALRKHLDLGICSSPAVQEEVHNRFGISSNKTSVVYNGVNVIDFPQINETEQLKIRNEFNIQPDELMLVNIGRVDTQKGLDVLIAAFRHVISSGRKAKLIQVGGVVEGTNSNEMTLYLDRLKANVKKHQLESQFIFAGWRDDCPTLLKAADMYVHSALWEGWSLAVVEAMGAKLPVIFTDCTGHPAGFINGTHGTIVPKGDSLALGEAVNDMIDLTHKQRTDIGEAGYLHATENYEITVTGPKFVKLVEAAIN